MDGLRLALIIAGIAVVAAVYFWSARRRRFDREAGDFDRFDAWTDDSADPLAEEPASGAADDAGGETLVDPDAMTQRNVVRRATGAAAAMPCDPAPVAKSPGAQAPEPAVERARRTAASLRLDAPDIDGVPETVIPPEPEPVPVPVPGQAPEPEVATRPAPSPATTRGTGAPARGARPAASAAAPPQQRSLEGLDDIANAPAPREEPRIGDLDHLAAAAGASTVASRARTGSPRGGKTTTRGAKASASKRGRGAAGRGAGRDKDGYQDAAEAEPELVVVLNVLAAVGEQFDGPALRDALEAAGLRAGDMQLYHYRAEAQPAAAPPIFSALNAVKPGTLDPGQFEGMLTPGIALVLRLPGLERPSEAFELMHDTAQAIAAALGGRICDETRSTLTGQALNHIRETIADYVRRRRVGS